MLESVLARMERACRRAGREPESVELLAVTKGHSVDEIRPLLLRKGITQLAENRIQEWREKAEELADEDVEWHFIGNLQRNKVKYCRSFRAIHSLNSERLARELQRHGERHDHTFRVLVEVNIAGEHTKLGASRDETLALVAFARAQPNLEVTGLMTMAPHFADPERARPVFSELRVLRDKLGLVDLSMGMSNDFEIAIEEGATIVRVGSALFEGSES